MLESEKPLQQSPTKWNAVKKINNTNKFLLMLKNKTAAKQPLYLDNVNSP